MIKEITSLQNDLVKEVLHLQEKSRARKKNGLFVIEGVREISLALEGGYRLQRILFCEEILKKAGTDQIPFLEKVENNEVVKISLKVYQKLAHRKKTEGIIAVASSKTLLLNDLSIDSNSLILIAEATEKPGNTGALLRTADAAQVDAVIIANPLSDLYNPNIIRSSVGCVFTNQIAMGNTDEILDFLKSKGINIFTAVLDESSKPYYEMDFTGPTAIVVGTESTGLSDLWIKNTTQNIMIPMQGKIDSLNVSVSAAILIFEAKRQRNFETPGSYSSIKSFK